MALIAAEEALKDAGLDESDMEETGVNIGMGIADLELIYEVGKQIEAGRGRRVTPFFVPRILTNMPAGHVSIKYVCLLCAGIRISHVIHILQARTQLSEKKTAQTNLTLPGQNGAFVHFLLVSTIF